MVPVAERAGMTDGSTTTDTTDSAATDRYKVLVVGGGVAGLTAAVFTARAGLETLVVNSGE